VRADGQIGAWLPVASPRYRRTVRMAVSGLAVGLPWRMADSSEAAAELRISRVKALDERSLVAAVTYMLARYPDSFPAMLDDALSTLSPKADQ
jgi:hypothetical protein